MMLGRRSSHDAPNLASDVTAAGHKRRARYEGKFTGA